MFQLTLHLLGAPRIELGGEPVELDTRKAVALLAYLAVTGERHTRDSVAALLWPEYDQSRSRANLRRTLSVLKSAVKGYGLQIRREAIGLDPKADIWIDVLEFHQLIAECNEHDHLPAEVCDACLDPMTQAVALYRGDFMAGFSLRDSPGFDDWHYGQSEGLRRDMARVLKSLAECVSQQERLEAAIDYARRWLELDVLHEPAHRRIMELYALAGQRNAALRQYRSCVRILEEELGVPPLEETTALYERILSGDLGAQQSHKVDQIEIVQKPAPTPETERPRPITKPVTLPLVGRDTEWANLLNAYESVEVNGRFLVLEGEAGIGKTRLAQGFVDLMRDRGVTTLVARCYEGESKLAYGPVVEALRTAVAQIGRSERWQEMPPQYLAEASRLLPELTRLGPGTLAPTYRDSPGAQSRLFEAISQLLQFLLKSEEAGVFLVDDLQWADESTLDLLTYLVRRLSGRRLFLLLTWRNGQLVGPKLHHFLTEGQRSGNGTVITLERLDEAAVQELVQAALGGGAEATAMARRLYKETEGLPHFLVEYLALVDSGLERRKSGQLTVGDKSDTDQAWPMPGGVRDLLLSRLATVDETGRQLLHTAAVIGRSFDFGTLQEASGRGEEETISGLEMLIAQGLVVEQTIEMPRSGVDALLSLEGPWYDFSHEKLRTLAYEQTSLARRRLLHRRVAEALISSRRAGSGRSTGDPPPAQIAFHYQHAGREDAAAEYYKAAGDDARALYANTEALTHYRSALALGHSDVADLHEAIGDLCTLQGDYDAALSNYETAAAMAERQDESGKLSRLEHKIGNVYHRQGEWELAASQFEAALAIEEDRGERARLMADSSLASHFRGTGKKAFDQAKEAIELAEAAGDSRALAQAHNILGILASSRSELDSAYYHLERSLALADSLDDPGVKIAALNNLALACRASGDVERAQELVETALALCIEQGDRHREAALHNNLADILHESGESETSMVHLKRAVAIYAEIGGEADEWRPEIWKLTEW